MHTTIYSRLTAEEQALLTGRLDSWSASVAPAGITIPGTDELLTGISYSLDHRAEEEYGIGELRTALTGKDPENFRLTEEGRAFARTFDDVNGFVLSTTPVPTGPLVWGAQLDGWRQGDAEPAYAERWAHRVAHLQRTATDPWDLGRTPKKTLTTMARDAGVKAPSTLSKETLVNELLARSPRERAWAWPGWFNNGKQLVVRADTGITATIVAGLCEAINEGTLSVGQYSVPFGGGVFLCDSRDETEELRAEVAETFRVYNAQMAQLKPVKDELKARGHYFYFLGRPRIDANGTLVFWLNGSGNPQPHGWYNLEELLAEKFIDDAKNRQR